MDKAAPRRDKSVLGQWWQTVDRWTLGALFALTGAGVLLVTAASPSVAERIGVTPFHFVYRHLAFVAPCVFLLVAMSLPSPRTLWRIASIVLVAALALVAATILFGMEIKGATRWIHVFGFSLQPSEFLKPAYAVCAAWLIARQQEQADFPGHKLALALFAASLGLLLLQPDFGMSFVLCCIWGAQVFLAGLPLVWIGGLAVLGVCGAAGAYLAFPHVASRIDRFLDPAGGDNYQVQKSLDAFNNGGLFGTGPAHGQVKLTLPDAHADFIFAVAGEEMGLLFTLLIVCVYAIIILRSMVRALRGGDVFAILCVGGLLTQFAVQSLVHMCSSLQLLPAKGMTLPFISYGGSSLLSLGFGMGCVLALTRKRPRGPAPS